MSNHDHPFCDVYNNDVALALACITAIRWELGVVDSKLPRAIHSRLGSIGVPLLEWCLWVLKDISFAFSTCVVHNIRINAATDALIVLNSLICDPRGMQLIRAKPRSQEVVDIVVDAFASVAGLAFWHEAVVPSMFLVVKLHNTPHLHDMAVESLQRHTPTVPVQILRHVAAFSHRDLEPLPDSALKRLPVEVHIYIMTRLCSIHLASVFITHNAPTWVCRAFARVLTIPFEDWERTVELLENPFENILAFFQGIFEADLTLIPMKAALCHHFIRSLVRCLSEVSRQKRLGQGVMKSSKCAPLFEAVILQVCHGVRTSGTILRLVCRAMDRLDLVEEEKERFLSKDEDYAVTWAAWDVLKDTISKARKEWVVDPNMQSGWRCMNPQCTSPYARRLKRCTECQFLIVCSRACQEHMWTTLDHRSRCFNFASCLLAFQQNDEGHDIENCRCQQFTLI